MNNEPYFRLIIIYCKMNLISDNVTITEIMNEQPARVYRIVDTIL